MGSGLGDIRPAATTLADIGSRSGLGKATLYHYFPRGKRSIFEQALASIVDEIWDDVEAKVRTAPDPYQQLLAYIWLRIEAFDREMIVRGMEPNVWAEIRPVAEQALGVYFQRERALLTELIEVGVRDKVIRPCRVDLAVRVLQAALKGLTSDGPLDSTPAQRRRDTEAMICEEVMEAFAEHDDIQFAYPTTRFFTNQIEGKPGVRPQDL